MRSFYEEALTREVSELKMARRTAESGESINFAAFLFQWNGERVASGIYFMIVYG